jgi:nucleotide-binding universal stress UspA family protein
MPHILAAMDFSEWSQRALRRAGLLARQSTAQLTLVHVVDDGQPQTIMESLRREALKLLEQVNAPGVLQGIPCRAVVTTGESFDGILKTAKDVSADLIVMGAHRKQLLRDIFIETTIEQVIRTGPYPVLIVNQEAEHPYREVLAAVDMSAFSALAIRTAESLGLLDGNHVTVVHAFATPDKGKLFIADASREEIDKYVADERSRVSAALTQFLATHEIRGQGWLRRLEEGDAFEAISRVAKETSPDLVIVGTRGHSALAKVLLGSVAEEVLRSLAVDILAVPPKSKL